MKYEGHLLDNMYKKIVNILFLSKIIFYNFLLEDFILQNINCID
jgi:hypothetical protein